MKRSAEVCFYDNNNLSVNISDLSSAFIMIYKRIMFEALLAQQAIYDQFQGEYFFCSSTGKQICRSNLLNRVWIPTLKKAGLEFRSIKQTRHSFATTALSCGENPLWIAKIMGHRDTNMIIKVYSKYVENMVHDKDGSLLSGLHMQMGSKKK